VRPSWIFPPLALCLFLLQACERDIPPVAEPAATAGYQIEGFVLDALGNPVRGLPIAIYYDFELVDKNPPPSKVYQPSDPAAIVRVTVFDLLNRPLVTLFQGRPPEDGYLEIDWDQEDAFGNPVPSGAYTVQYIVGGQTKMSYPVVVSGNVVTTTDTSGHYIIPNQYLPVGFYPVPLYSADSSSFLGNYQITPYVVLEFRLQTSRYGYVILTQDQITRFDFKL
jgi:hypothetical protein